MTTKADRLEEIKHRMRRGYEVLDQMLNDLDWTIAEIGCLRAKNAELQRKLTGVETDNYRMLRRLGAGFPG